MTIDLTVDAPALITEFAEAVRVRTSSADASPRTISVNVNRAPIEGFGDAPFDGALGPIITIEARNDSTNGIASDGVVEDQWQVEVASKRGDTVRWRTISRLLKHNAGITLVEVLT